MCCKDRLLTSFCVSVSLELLNKFEGVRLAPSSEGFLFLIRSVVLLLLLALLLVGDSLSLLMIVTTASLSPSRGVSGLSSSSVLPRIRLKMLLSAEPTKVCYMTVCTTNFKCFNLWPLASTHYIAMKCQLYRHLKLGKNWGCESEWQHHQYCHSAVL